MSKTLAFTWYVLAFATSARGPLKIVQISDANRGRRLRFRP